MREAGRQQVIEAFLKRHSRKSGNYMSNGTQLLLFGNVVAEHTSDRETDLYSGPCIMIQDAGWRSKTTLATLRHLLHAIVSPYRLETRKGVWWFGLHGNVKQIGWCGSAFVPVSQYGQQEIFR